MRTVAYIDGNVSLLFEILLASMPAYTMLGHMHSRVRYVNILTNQLHASLKVHPRASLKLFNDFFFFFFFGEFTFVERAILCGNVLANSKFSLGRFFKSQQTVWSE